MAQLRDYEDDWRGGYIDLVRTVCETGEVRNSRVGPVMEIRDCMFTLGPRAIDLPLGTGRKIHTALAAAEAIQLCAGVGMPALTEAASKEVAAFVRDPDGTVHGNYGHRVGAQIMDVVDKLRFAPDSRQAVLQVWDKYRDSVWRDPMPKDIPCTLTLTFGIRDGALDLSVSMRSSDVWLGIPYDVFQFRQLQRTIARLLGRSIGDYCHHSVSMHAYDRDLGKIAGLSLDADREFFQDNPAPKGLYADRAVDLAVTMHNVLKGDDLTCASHEWYYARLGTAYATALG